jgi:hypothetical protein
VTAGVDVGAGAPGPHAGAGDPARDRQSTTRRPPRAGRARVVLASGALLVVAVLLTAAAVSDHADVHVALDGSGTTFDIEVAGAVGAPAWTPAAADWEQGNPQAYRLAVDAAAIAPGGAVDLRLAVRDASPLAGVLSLTVEDPQPRGDATDASTGRYLELFDRLVFTVRDGDRAVIDRVAAPDLETWTWPQPLAAGEEKVLDVRIELPAEVDDRWQGASTDVRFRFEAVNA